MSVLYAIRAELERFYITTLRVSPSEMQVWSEDDGTGQPQVLITTLREADNDTLAHVEPYDVPMERSDLPGRLCRLVNKLGLQQYTSAELIRRPIGQLTEIDLQISYPVLVECDNPACYESSQYCENGHDHDGDEKQIILRLLHDPKRDTLSLR